MKIPGIGHYDSRIRPLEIERQANDDGTIPASFSSETPVLRYWGWEILDHGPDAVDLSRVRNGKMPLLVTHDMSEVPRPGNILQVRVENRRTRGNIDLSNTPRGQSLREAIENGYLDATSIRYEYLSDPVQEGTDENGIKIWRVPRWRLMEGSLVNIGGDHSVGPQRSLSLEDETVRVVVVKEESQMDPCEKCGKYPCECGQRTPAAAPAATPPAPAATPPKPTAAPAVPVSGGVRQVATEPVSQQAHQQPDREAEIERILDLGAEYEKLEMARQYVKDKKSVNQFESDLLRELKGPTKTFRPVKETDGDLGMSRNEIDRYRVIKLLRAAMDPNDRRIQDDAGLKLECSREFQKKALREGMRKEVQGLSIPPEMMRAPYPGFDGRRAMEVGDGGSGGYLVEETLLPGAIIEYLWKRIVVSPLVTRMTGLVGNILIPTEKGEPTVSWIGEDGEATETSGEDTFGMRGAVARTMAIRFAMTRKLLMQSSLDVEIFARRLIGRKHGSEIERVLINGLGVNGEPLGVLNVDGIGSVTFGDTAISWAKMVELETDVADADADVGRMAYLLNAVTRGQGKTTPKESGQATYIISDNNTCNGYPALITNHVPKTLGAGSNRSAGIFANWEDVFLMLWAGMDFIVDRVSSNTGKIIYKSFQDLDTVLRHPESVSAGTDIDHAA